MYLVLVFLHILAVFAFSDGPWRFCSRRVCAQTGTEFGAHPRTDEPFRCIHRGCTHFPARRPGTGCGDGIHGKVVGARLDLGLTRFADRDVCLYGSGRIRFLREGAQGCRAGVYGGWQDASTG